MTSNKGIGPSLLCEWMVGTTIPTALGSAKSSKRDVIKVEVTTDEESDADSIKITYPRPTRARRKKPAPKSEIKKVRFEAVPAQKKSALKKADTYIVTSASEPSDSEAESSDASTDTSASEQLINIQPVQVHAVNIDDSSASEASSDANSDVDSDPHPTCKCTGCIRGRQKQVRRKRRARHCMLASSTDGTPESETDDSSEDEKEVKRKKAKAKAKETKSKKVKSTKESESESESESEPAKEHKKQDKKKDKKAGKKKDKKSEETSSEKLSKLQKNQKEGRTTKRDKNKKSKDTSLKAWPECRPGPDPRRPHLIEPIRAEVVQTERVIESPEDPAPNAYYDPQHNVLRLYHGPVYGSQPNAGLYPKRDSSNRPLPIGSVHPSQNPYYWGFAGMPAAQGANMEQGYQVPNGPWNHMGIPPGYPPFAPGGPAQRGPPLQSSSPKAASGGSKGAFSDQAGRNNVVPGSTKSLPVNKYYSPQKTSPFAAFNKPATNISPVPLAWGATGDGAPASTRHSPQQHVSPPENNGNSSWNNESSQAQGWNSNNAPAQDSTWNGGDNSNDTGNQNDNSNTSGNWGNNDSNGDSNNGNNFGGETPDWGPPTNNPDANSSWGHNGNNVAPVDTANGGWENTTSPNSQPSNGASGSNVMPGEFPGWGGDMAADSGGKVDLPGGDIPATGW